MPTINNLGIIGGSGLYTLADCLPELPNSSSVVKEQLLLPSPWAESAIELECYHFPAGTVYFLPRHGQNHGTPPHLINYRANLWALKEVGVSEIIAVNAVGGISATATAGSIVIPDQLIDYTWGRAHTYNEGNKALNGHIDFTFPFNPAVRQKLLDIASQQSVQVVSHGTYACTQGPRLETAAEIRKLASDGNDIVGMTAMPEAALAKELEIAYASLAIVVNAAAGVEQKEITLVEIKQFLTQGISAITPILQAFIAQSVSPD